MELHDLGSVFFDHTLQVHDCSVTERYGIDLRAGAEGEAYQVTKAVNQNVDADRDSHDGLPTGG
jgi:hypothetical protein